MTAKHFQEHAAGNFVLSGELLASQREHKFIL